MKAIRNSLLSNFRLEKSVILKGTQNWFSSIGLLKATFKVIVSKNYFKKRVGLGKKLSVSHLYCPKQI